MIIQEADVIFVVIFNFFFLKGKYCGGLYPFACLSFSSKCCFWHLSRHQTTFLSILSQGKNTSVLLVWEHGQCHSWSLWFYFILLFFSIFLTLRLTRGKLWSEGRRTDSLILYLNPSQEENHLPTNLIHLSWAAWCSGSALLFSFFFAFLWRWCEWFCAGTAVCGTRAARFNF